MEADVSVKHTEQTHDLNWVQCEVNGLRIGAGRGENEQQNPRKH